MHRINYKSDFKLREETKNIDTSVPFKFTYKTWSEPFFIASFDGHTYTNCKRMPDGKLMVIFNDHKLKPGKLLVMREYFLSDKDFSDGECHHVSYEDTGIELSLGKSDKMDVTIQVYPNYQKGEKGDKLTFKDLTPEDIAQLQKPASDAAIIAENSASKADTATEKALASVKLANDATKSATEQADRARTEADRMLAFTTSINVSNAYPTGSPNQSNIYTLESAINVIEERYRTVGLKCSFLTSPKEIEEYQYVGGEYQNVSSWVRTDATRIESINDRLSENENELNISKRTVKPVNIEGEFISKNGTIVKLNAYNRSEPFQVYAGEQIDVRVKAGSDVAVIAKANDDGTYEPLSISIAPFPEIQDFKCVFSQDCMIVISFIIGSLDVISLVKSKITLLNQEVKVITSKNEEQIKYISDNLNSIGVHGQYIELNTAIRDKYVHSITNQMLELKGYRISESFNAHAGDVVHFKSRISKIAASIIKVNDDGTYTTIFAGKDVDKFYDIYYRFNTDIKVAICSLDLEKFNVRITASMFDGGFVNRCLNDNTRIISGVVDNKSSEYINLGYIASGEKISLNVISNSDQRYDVSILGKSYIANKHLIVEDVSHSDFENLVIRIISNESVSLNLTYTVAISRGAYGHAQKSKYDLKINELDKRTGVRLSLPSGVSYKDLEVGTQEKMNTLSDDIKAELTSGATNVNVIFKNGIYFYDDTNKIKLNSLDYPNVNIRFTCENAQLTGKGKVYKRNERIAIKGNRNVFPYEGNFDKTQVFTDGERIFFPDMTGGYGSFTFLSEITAENADAFIYKAKVPSFISGKVIGKKIIFTAWWAAITADITNVSVAGDETYISFKINPGEVSYVNADMKNYNVPALAKIINLEDELATDTYYIDNGKIYLPDCSTIYECEFGRFLEVEYSKFASVICANMNFVGAALFNTPLISFHGTSNMFVLGCKFKAIGTYCLNNTYDNKENGNILVENCIFVDCDKPIAIEGNKCAVLHNKFKRSGYEWMSNTALMINGGNDFYVAYNNFEDFSYSAITVSGGIGVNQSKYNGIIEYNVVDTKDWDVSYRDHQLIDSGAIQISITNFPLIVRHNFINNYKTRKSGRGIMMGGNCSQVAIYKNLITNCPSYTNIDFYAGTEKNKFYPNGVENLLMYNIVEGCVNMIGGDDFTNPEYSSVYNKEDNDCTCGINLVGGMNYMMSDQFLGRVVNKIPHIEQQLSDPSMEYRDNTHILLSYDLTNWNLSPFIMSRLALRNK